MTHRAARPLVVGALGVVLAVLVGCGAQESPAAPADQPDRAGERSESDTPIVQTDAGPARGSIDGGIATFRGIPYAAPPTGDLRWAPPHPARPWSEPRDAAAPGPMCAQNGLELGRPSLDEDCLTLEVTRPAAGRTGRPVLVWVHGGSHKDGSGSLYGASRLARAGDAVVVTINYRLGAFGWFAHPSLPGAENLGLADQQAALQWVQRNAAAFGGDPNNVTLAGESGGGAAVCAQLASPAADGLFAKAIIQSADCTATWSPERSSAPRPRDLAERRGRAVADRLGCPDPATAAPCLRSKSVAEIRQASDDGEGVGPSTGTTLLPVDPARALAAGQLRAVPTLIGFNRDEERFRIYGEELGSGRPTTTTDLRTEVDRIAGPRAAAVHAAYPCADDSCAATTLAELLTARNYAHGVVAAAERLSERAPTFAYEFADPHPPWFRALPPARFPPGAYHTAELSYLFDVDWTEPLAPHQRALSDQMIGYWTRFARHGDPGGQGAPSWAAYTGPTSAQTLAPGPDGIRPATDLAERHRLRLWDALAE